MRFAIQTPPEHTDFPALVDVWAAADDLGYWGAFTFDHFVPLNEGRPGRIPGRPPPGPQLEGWVSLTALAAKTARLHVGTLVSGVTYRHPVLLAKMAVTLDHATGGRAVLGIGAAWHEVEHRMYGLEFPPVGERISRLAEALEIFRSLCSHELTNYEGRYYRIRDAVFDPKPVSTSGIPVLVGGSGSRLKRIAARHADIFNSFAAPWEWPSVNGGLDDELQACGRSPRQLVRSAFVFSELSGDQGREEVLVEHFQRTRGGTQEEVRARVLIGSPDEMGAVVKSYEAAGIELMVINVRPPYTSRGIERFAREVIPAFAE